MNKERAFSTKYEDHTGLIHKFSKGGFARLEQFNTSMDYDDIYQENCVSLVKAQKTYNPECGIGFSAYMGRSMINNFNKLADKLIRENTEIGLFSLEGFSDDDGELDGFKAIEDTSAGPESDLEMTQEARARLAKLSKPARSVIRDLIRPSIGLIEHHRAEYAQSCHGKEMGVPVRRIPIEIDLRYIVKFHGMTFRAFEMELKDKLDIEFS